MGTSRSPVEFTDTSNQRAGNKVVISGSNGNVIGIVGNPLAVKVEPVLGAAADVHAPAANTAAVVTYAVTAGQRHVITGAAWSYYGGVPTGGNLSITEGANTILTIDIPEEGAGFVEFPRPKSGAIGAAMVVTLAAGGAGITGKVSVLNHWTEAV